MQGKTVIITGGSSGIGKALAESFGKRGANILITGRRAEALEEAANDLRAEGITVETLAGDVSQPEDNERMAAFALQKFGRIDVLICNAGISMRALFEDVDLSVVKQVMDINFYGALYSTKACLPQLLQNKGSVIGISSIAGFRGLPGRTGYSASKFALNGFLEVLRTETMHQGLHVLTAAPGFTTSNIRKTALAKDGSTQGESPRNESKMMTAQECAERIYRATLKRKKFLVMTTLGVFTVWLNKFFPGFMDKMTFNAMDKEADSPLKRG